MRNLLRVLALGFGLGSAAIAQAGEALKLCVSDNDLPYTNERLEGFEDRLGDLIGAALGQPVERVRFGDPRFMVRDGLDKGRCDLMMGVDIDDPRVQTTSPYYRSSYVFLTRAEGGPEVSSWRSEALKTARIGLVPGTPAETMLIQIGRYADSFRYLMSLGGNKAMRNRFIRYDVEKLVRDLAAGEIDVAVAWAPAVARYVKASPVPLKAVVVPDDRKANGEVVRFSYDTSMGLKKDNAQLLSKLEPVLQQRRAEIEGLLSAEGIRALTPSSPRLAQGQAPLEAASR